MPGARPGTILMWVGDPLVAINFCVKVACFEITSGYFGQYPGRHGLL
jgi:hypothetical protein